LRRREVESRESGSVASYAVDSRLLPLTGIHLLVVVASKRREMKLEMKEEWRKEWGSRFRESCFRMNL
jgi:hypothetical protein